nr:polysaccharide biosynthesis C-terminal domain-containing protein [Chloroflexota bacterium]
VDDLVAIWLLRRNLRFRLRIDTGQVRTLIGAALPLGLVMVINSLYFKIDAVLLSLLAEDAAVALYGVAYRIFEMALPLSAYIMVTLLPELARLEVDDPRFGRLVQYAFTMMSLIALPLGAFALCAPEIMTVIGGAAYAQGANVLVLVMISLALATVNGVFGWALVSQGRQGVLLKVSVAVLVVNVGLNLLLIPAYGVTGTGMALVATELLSLVATAVVFGRQIQLPRPHRPVRTVLAGAGMAAGVSVKFLIDLPALATLALAGAVGITCYGVALWALGAVPPAVRQALRDLVGPRLRRAADAA